MRFVRPVVRRRPLIAVVIVGLVALFAAGRWVIAPGTGDEPTAQGLRHQTGDQRLEHDGVVRTYSVYVPQGYDPGRTHPMVLVFHGGFGSGRLVASRIGMNAVADRHGVLVVYPDGLDRHWNDGRATTADGADDVGFIAALLDRLQRDYAVDAGRIYATGLSNGGNFTQRLACESSDRIAAFASVMTAMPVALAKTCDPDRAVPMMLIAGTDDPLVPWEGGELTAARGLGGKGGAVIPVHEAAAFWAREGGCLAEPSVTMLPDADPDDGTRVKRLVYDGCRGEAEVVLLAVEGGGHTWPGSEERPRLTKYVGRTSQDIDASAVIWQFLGRHALPELSDG